MSEKLQQEQEAKQTRGFKSAALEQQGTFWVIKISPPGAGDGKVMVVEFFDYQCIWCSRFAPELEKVIGSNQDALFLYGVAGLR
jgi:protein-disulfide isomerase